MRPDPNWPFEYVGGGWFRQKGVPKGKQAQIIHATDALEHYADFVSWPKPSAAFSERIKKASECPTNS